ncbi:MAG: cell division ATPase MinD [ANME-2 cluster archaeon]|nr:cell division ATPase MinD [ANME-2 cluster archaeon]
MTSETYLVLSGKGGVGKTTVFSNVATSIAMMGKKTVIIDADLAMANLGLIFGLQDMHITLHEVLAGKASISEAIYAGPGGLEVVPCGDNLAGFQEADPAGLVEVIDYFQSRTEFIFIDGPVGLNEDIFLMLPHIDHVILIATPDLVSMADALKTKVIVESFGCRIKGIVMNRVDTMNLDEITIMVKNTLELDILSVIPNDPKIKEAAMKMIPLVTHIPDSPASIAMTMLAANIAGVEYTPPIRDAGWFQRLIGKIRKRGIENYGPN